MAERSVRFGAGSASRSAQATRVAELAGRYGLGEAARSRLLILAELLASDSLAPTSVRNPLGVVDDHLADSLVALELPAVREARALADLGAGAGVPGLPLAIALPQIKVALIESNGRKCAFIERAIAACKLRNARAVNARAEAWDGGAGRIDVVTARALGPPAVVAEYAAPLLRMGGLLVIWRGRRDPEAELAGAAAAAELGLEVRNPIPVDPYRGANNRHLHLMLKVRETPKRFPRRPGVAAKSPLAGRSSPAGRPSASDRAGR